MLYVGKGPRGSNVCLLHFPQGFSHSVCYPQSIWAPLVLVPEWVGLCTPLAPVGLSKDLSCEAGSFPWCHPNPHGRFQSEVWGFISLCWSPALCSLLRSPLFIPVYLCVNVGPWSATRCSAGPFSATLSPALSVYLGSNVGPQGLLVVGLPALFVPHSASLSPATATRVPSAPLPISAPPTGLDVCFFFIYLV